MCGERPKPGGERANCSPEPSWVSGIFARPALPTVAFIRLKLLCGKRPKPGGERVLVSQKLKSISSTGQADRSSHSRLEFSCVVKDPSLEEREFWNRTSLLLSLRILFLISFSLYPRQVPDQPLLPGRLELLCGKRPKPGGRESLVTILRSCRSADQLFFLGRAVCFQYLQLPNRHDQRYMYSFDSDNSEMTLQPSTIR